jgi:hypothetical protein
MTGTYSGFSTNPTISGNVLTMTSAVMNAAEASVTLTVTHTDSEGTTGQTQTIIVRATKVPTGAKGDQGDPGADGTDGTDGTDGSDGRRTATGLVYYQLSAVSAPSTPSATSFTFSTGNFGGLTSNWAKGAPTFAAGNSNKYWYSTYTAVESTAGGDTATPTFSTPVQAIGFTGLVTFTSANNISDGGSYSSEIIPKGSITNHIGGADVTTINGGKVSTGVITSTGYTLVSGDTLAAGGYTLNGTIINLDNGSLRSKNFFISSSGDAFFRGTLSAAGGSFTGELVAASGYFSGSIAATNGYIGNWVLTGPLLYASANSKKVQLSANIPSVELYSGTNLVVDINANTTLSPKSATPPTFGAASINQASVLFNQGYTNWSGTEWYYSGDEATGDTTTLTIPAGNANIGKTCIVSATVGGAISNTFESSGDDVNPVVNLVYQKYTIEYGFKLSGPSGYVSYNSIYYDGSQVRGGIGPYTITQPFTSQTLSTSLVLAEGTYTITPYVRNLYAGSVMNIVSPPAAFSLNVLTPSLTSIEASIPISKTELGAGGFQVVFSSTRYLEVQRADNANFVAVGGGITATGNITAYYSDRRLKNILGNIDNPLDKIQKLNGVYYEENELAKSFGYDSDCKQVGLIAQEVEEVLPEIIHLAPFDDDKGVSISGENYMTVQYDRVIPLLVESIKELKKEIEELKNNK